MAEQLPLSLSSPEHATFENFCAAASPSVVSLLQSLTRTEGPELLYLWGGEGVGKSHLLHASCNWLQQQGMQPLFLPLGTLSSYPAASAMSLLQGLERYAVVVLDDLERVVGSAPWEEMLFHLLNHARDHGQRVVVAAAAPLVELKLGLPDLRSRLGEAVVEQVEALSGEEKWVVLQQRAASRGMALSDEVVAFLMKRTPRDFYTLFQLLEQLDRQTLARQRKITIPFVKELLAL